MLSLSHKNLDVYKICIDLCKEVYCLVKQFPKEEQFVLSSQIKRAAISICSNIAEGASRFSIKEKNRFYEIAPGSLVELDTQFELALMLEYCRNDNIVLFEKQLEHCFRMLSAMIKKLKIKLRDTGNQN
jgi:four helix bundle protein